MRMQVMASNPILKRSTTRKELQAHPSMLEMFIVRNEKDM